KVNCGIGFDSNPTQRYAKESISNSSWDISIVLRLRNMLLGISVMPELTNQYSLTGLSMKSIGFLVVPQGS
ncbi:hypothetical protein, partial [Cytobacillus firmus]|uniref:hypothetical protein n=1 Tax=Cytobacillus firmus TaxID=1399 RepID=UPI001C2E03D1